MKQLLIYQAVYCPIINELISVDVCADHCNYYEGEEDNQVKCTYGDKIHE